ncbi:hypothetical protein ABT126_38990 [Streptomyces sp. NPDC002012]|uniref:hypothetical protein n=1 Tax=Streptomyces sp. NPDC002012 TaxID=3154532 RepID=UPI003331BD07
MRVVVLLVLDEDLSGVGLVHDQDVVEDLAPDPFDGQPHATVLGPETREQFATVILARFTTDTWERLVPMAGPAPKQRHPQPGCFHVVQQGSTHETQAVRMTDADVVNWLTDPEDNEG